MPLARGNPIQEDLHGIPYIAGRMDPHDAIVDGSVDDVSERVIRVHPRRGREGRIEGEAEEPLVVIVADVRERVERVLQDVAVLDNPDFAAGPVREEDTAVRGEREGRRAVQPGLDDLESPGHRGSRTRCNDHQGQEEEDGKRDRDCFRNRRFGPSASNRGRARLPRYEGPQTRPGAVNRPRCHAGHGRYPPFRGWFPDGRSKRTGDWRNS